MNKYIVINLNMFAATHSVTVCDNDGMNDMIGVQTIEGMPNFITEYAYSNDIYNVKIIGNSKYAQLIEYGIGLAETSRYRERKIEIEVI